MRYSRENKHCYNIKNLHFGGFSSQSDLYVGVVLESFPLIILSGGFVYCHHRSKYAVLDNTVILSVHIMIVRFSDNF